IRSLTRLAALAFVTAGLAQAEEDELPLQSTGGFLIQLAPAKSRAVGGGANADGWTLTPLAGAKAKDGGTAADDWWYLAPDRRLAPGAKAPGSPWDEAYDLYSSEPRGVPGKGSIGPVLKSLGIQQEEVKFIEPDLVVSHLMKPASEPRAATHDVTPGVAFQGTPPSGHWPKFDKIGAYQEKEFSQLKPAREQVEKRLKEQLENRQKIQFVRAAFLDTGYDSNHVASPPKKGAAPDIGGIQEDLAVNFVVEDNHNSGVSLTENPGPPGSQSHGTGTIGIFAGQKVTIRDEAGKELFSGALGGAPMVEVVPMRVATMVVHLENPFNPFLSVGVSATTRAIRHAIATDCDVISMSHGGLPSRALADAVNAAYEHGIAMFFASGDYLQPPNLPIWSPRYVVFPAAFSRTICVCGATARLATYGIPPGEFDDNNGPPQSWILRGNWGPVGWMKNAIAAFSPNVPWPHQPKKDSSEPEDLVDFDGQGTSASTPQVAAAAALWLQFHREDETLKKDWRTWRKAEAVYQALLTSAKKLNDAEYMSIDDGMHTAASYTSEYFGNGILQADVALLKDPASLTLKPQKKASVDLGWIRLLGSIGHKRGGPDDDVLEEMLNLEIAQLAAQTVKAQEAIEKNGGAIPDEKEAKPEESDFRTKFFTAIRENPNCSRRLADRIDQGLSTRQQ
ncbi:MAG TPA: S8/S53 family peptidase, partial [Terrimicrobiaceae bacterium]